MLTCTIAGRSRIDIAGEGLASRPFSALTRWTMADLTRMTVAASQAALMFQNEQRSIAYTRSASIDTGISVVAAADRDDTLRNRELCFSGDFLRHTDA